VQNVINNSFHFSLKTSPSKLLLGYDQREHSDAELVKILNNIVVTMQASLRRDRPTVSAKAPF